MPLSALVLHRDDNVATAVRPLAGGESIRVDTGDVAIDIRLLRPIPFGHKLALRDIRRGGKIIKYGETIGRATAGIKRGEPVHVHNVEGLRGRGDRP